MFLSQFANEGVDARFELRLEPEVQTFMWLLAVFALRGVMPQQVRLDHHEDLALLVVHARLGAHDAQVLATRLSTAFGVVDAGWCAADQPLPVPACSSNQPTTRAVKSNSAG